MTARHKSFLATPFLTHPPGASILLSGSMRFHADRCGKNGHCGVPSPPPQVQYRHHAQNPCKHYVFLLSLRLRAFCTTDARQRRQARRNAANLKNVSS